MHRPPIDKGWTATRMSARHERDFTPVSWMEYFDEAHDIIAPSEPNQYNDQHDSFRVYLKNFRSPYAPERELGKTLDPSRLEISSDKMRKYSEVPTLVMLHGGGYSALTWAEFSRNLRDHCLFRLLAIDLRSHGDTKTADHIRMDIDTLISDTYMVIHETHRICGFPETPKIVLIGHSMGGAIAIKCAYRCAESLPSLIGFVVIDVVEGTAKEALPLMMSVIQTRPTSFPSLSNAIEWSFKSGMAKNCQAARVSMPGNLVNIVNHHLAIHDIHVDGNGNDDSRTKLFASLQKHSFHLGVDQLAFSNSFKSSLSISSPRIQQLKDGNTDQSSIFGPRNSRTMITEDDEEQSHGEKMDTTETELEAQSDEFKKPTEIKNCGYGWRTNLAMTQPYWNGWFDGLSHEMLEAPVQGKFLILAGVDRLDKALTIGQMQGKFKLQVLPKCGHAIHEDLPARVASDISDFLIRNKFTKSHD